MVAAWTADHQHEHRTLSHDRQVRNQVYNQNIFRPNRNHHHRIPIRNPTRKPQHHQSMYWRNIFRPNRNQQHRIPCSQPDPSARTPPTNVGAKYFSPVSQPATPHTLFATRPVSPNTTNQCRGEILFARIATSNTAYLVRNPTRQPQHHQPM